MRPIEWLERGLRSVVPSGVKSAVRSFVPGRRRTGANGRSGTFGALVDRRREWLFEHLPAESAAYHYDIFTKTSQKRLARRLGVPVADDHLVEVPLDEALAFVEASRLERFVIKPNLSYGAKGFRALERVDGAFRDLRTGAIASIGRIERQLRREFDLRARPDEWVVEELLESFDGSAELPDDYKVYCFGGTAELIVHKRPIPGTRRYHAETVSRDWEPIDVGLEPVDADAAVAPVNGGRLVQVAEAAASQLCYPFIRIDLYDSTKGVVLGEFTPGPGRRDAFDAEWDERLTRRWHEAAAAIDRGIRSGEMSPLSPE